MDVEAVAREVDTATPDGGAAQQRPEARDRVLDDGVNRGGAVEEPARMNLGKICPNFACLGGLVLGCIEADY